MLGEEARRNLNEEEGGPQGWDFALTALVPKEKKVTLKMPRTRGMAWSTPSSIVIITEKAN